MAINIYTSASARPTALLPDTYAGTKKWVPVESGSLSAPYGACVWYDGLYPRHTPITGPTGSDYFFNNGVWARAGMPSFPSNATPKGLPWKFGSYTLWNMYIDTIDYTTFETLQYVVPCIVSSGRQVTVGAEASEAFKSLSLSATSFFSRKHVWYDASGSEAYFTDVPNGSINTNHYYASTSKSYSNASLTGPLYPTGYDDGPRWRAGSKTFFGGTRCSTAAKFRAGNTPTAISWNGPTPTGYVWTDGTNYYGADSDGNSLQIYPDTLTTEVIQWDGLDSMVLTKSVHAEGPQLNIWTDGTDIFYSNGSGQNYRMVRADEPQDITPVYKKENGIWVKQLAYQRQDGVWTQISSK